eukprot:13339907-Alexandrium_andersonii.AAC.1
MGPGQASGARSGDWGKTGLVELPALALLNPGHAQLTLTLSTGPLTTGPTPGAPRASALQHSTIRPNSSQDGPLGKEGALI